MPSPPQTRPLKPAKDSRQSPRPTLPKKRQPSGRISAACEACKKRKTKCTGGPAPCQLCESLGTECVIDLTLDMRRRAALQRTIDESKSYQESLSGLLECLRDGDPTILKSLTASLRRDPSPQELSTMIQSLTQVIRDRENESSLDESIASPSEESVESLRMSQGGTNLVVPREESFETSTARRARSSPSGESRDRDLEGAGHCVALLQRLRASTNVEGERILRNLIDPDDLKNFLSQSVREMKPAQPGGTAVFTGYERRSNPSGLAEERRHWHPALQVGQDMQQPHYPTEREGTTNVSLAFRTTPKNRGSSTEPSSRSTHGFPTASLVPSSRGRDFDPQRQQAMMAPTSLSPARAPYTEPNTMPIRINDSDLCVIQEDSTYQWRVPIHLVLPLTIPDGSSMCRVYTEYLQAARRMIAGGDPAAVLLGPNDDIVVDLLFRQRGPNDRWDCSSWACELFRSFTEYEIYVRLANAFFLTRMMRWLLVPSIENYMKLPDMMKPTAIQRQVPHIGAVDLIPIPCIREAAIANLRDWLTPLGEARWSVNWPFSDQDAMERDPTTGSIRLTSRFMSHVENHDNWSVGSRFLTAFPEVAGKVNIHY